MLRRNNIHDHGDPMDDRFMNTARYDGLRSRDESQKEKLGEKLDVQHEEINAALTDYIRFLAAHHSFAREYKMDERHLKMELRKAWPKIDGREKQATAFLRVIDEVMHEAPVLSPAPDILMRVEVSSRPLVANVLPEPKEPTTIASFDSVRGVLNRCIVDPADKPPSLNEMSIPSGIMVIAQRISPVMNQFTDSHPSALGGGVSLYGERNRDPISLNNEDNISPIGMPWPRYLLQNQQFVDLYHQLYPADPRINLSHYAEEQHEDEDRIITEKDAAAIAAAAGFAAIEKRREAQAHEAHIQGKRGEESLRVRNEDNAEALGEQASSAERTLENEPIRETGVGLRNREIDDRTTEIERESGGRPENTTELVESVTAAETEIMAATGPERPETAPVADENSGIANEAVVENIAAAEVAAHEEGVLEIAGPGEAAATPIPGGVEAGETIPAEPASNVVKNQTDQVETRAKELAPEQPQKPSDSSEQARENRADQEESRREEPGRQEQSADEQRSEQTRSDETHIENDRQENEGRNETESRQSEQNESYTSRERHTENDDLREREDAREERVDERRSSDVANEDNSRSRYAVLDDAGNQSAPVNNHTGLAAHGIMHVAMDSHAVSATNAGYTAAFVTTPNAGAAPVSIHPTVASAAGLPTSTPLSSAGTLAAASAASAPTETHIVNARLTPMGSAAAFLAAQPKASTRQKSRRTATAGTSRVKSATPRKRASVRKGIKEAKRENDAMTTKAADNTNQPSATPNMPALTKG